MKRIVISKRRDSTHTPLCITGARDQYRNEKKEEDTVE